MVYIVSITKIIKTLVYGWAWCSAKQFKSGESEGQSGTRIENIKFVSNALLLRPPIYPKTRLIISLLTQ